MEMLRNIYIGGQIRRKEHHRWRSSGRSSGNPLGFKCYKVKGGRVVREYQCHLNAFERRLRI